MLKKKFRNLLNLREDLSFSFYLVDFIFRKLFRQNKGVKWAIHHTSTIRCPERLHVEEGCWPGDSPNVYINAINGVFVGKYSNLGPNVSIISANHDFINNQKHTMSEAIKIGQYCWLGVGAVILPEVCLGDFTVVGAGAIVTKSFEEGYCVLAGNPAKIIKYLNKDNCLQFANNKKA